ncbi:protein translocase subunit SecE [Bacterioplanes sanyensis]|uniref:preprotein translocase subunit SecE n=1 Tax=Bacterioplanes sanyensis TaxID=1249553 RepID=UPI001671BFFF|nr:preprotein translocase subunit SecE [Bacterioplanes sanyensis]GGY51743.1 protein translocase subunit SecE [Bacterioplanes sanyensis]
MSTESNAGKSPLDYAKWLLAAVFFAAAVWGNYHYTEIGTLYRVLGVVALMLISAGVALTSSQGKNFLQLLKEANIERRKVVWPTRQETTQTTLIVVAVVIFMALVLWGLDSLLGWLISLLIG